ncbi:MAG: SPOR domain-containing protein [Bacteroidales bacterium]|nr:SPOR domain-containing protein [Bacteroidales bacterium]
MRKSFLALIILLAVASSVTGCDFFRRLAGRPTSAEIEAKRQAIAQKESSDSLAALAAVESQPVQETEQQAAPETQTVPETKPEIGKKRFYIVMASFSNQDNARKCLAKMEERGYPGVLLGFKGGFTGVGICGTDDEQEAKESLKEIKRQDFCPTGVWIIDRNKR